LGVKLAGEKKVKRERGGVLIDDGEKQRLDEARAPNPNGRSPCLNERS
jgi:hypothetical protein